MPSVYKLPALWHLVPFCPISSPEAAVSTIASAPVVADDATTQVVFVRTRRNSFFGELFGIDASTESVSYIGAAGETAQETKQRINAIVKAIK